MKPKNVANLKQTLKRLFCMVLSIALAMGVLCTVSFAEKNEAVTVGSDVLGIMNKLGITSYNPETLTEAITRGEFFGLAAVTAGVPKIETESTFWDLNADDENRGYIDALAAQGVISGDSRNKIYPDKPIKLSEAAAVLLRLAGYGILADSNGGYPSGYMKEANRTELLLGLDGSADDELSKDAAVQLLYNALEIPVMAPKTYGDEDYTPVESGTFLENVFKTGHIEEVIDGVDLSRLYGENDVNAFFIEAGGMKLSVIDYVALNQVNIYDYLGYRTHIYYKTDRYDVPQVFYIEKSKNNTEVIIDTEDVSSISGRSIKAYVDGGRKQKNYTYGVNASLIYNGAASKSKLTMSLIQKTIEVNGASEMLRRPGRIRLVDNGGDGSYDVVFVDLYENYVVSTKDTQNKNYYDEYTGKVIQIDDNSDDPYVVVYKDGIVANSGSITAGNVISVSATEDGDAYQGYIRIYVNTDTIEGTVESVKNGGKVLNVDGEDYDVTDECRIYGKDLLKAGNDVKLFFDKNGKIAYIKANSEGNKYSFGFLIGAKKEGGLSKVLRLRIFTAEAEFVDFDTADNFTLDGNKKKNTDAGVIDILHTASDKYFGGGISGTCVSSMIRYTTNSKGEIKIIDTVLSGRTGDAAVRNREANEDDILYTLGTNGRERYNGSGRCIGEKMAVNNDTVCFIYPNPVTQNILDEDLYEIRAVSKTFTEGWNYEAVGLYKAYDELIASAAGIKADEPYINGAVVNGRAFSPIMDKYTKYNPENGETEGCIITSGTNGEIEIKLKKGFALESVERGGLKGTMSYEDLKIGDMIKYRTDDDGYMIYGALYFRSSNATLGIIPTGNSYLKRGFVYEKFDGGFLFYPTDSNDRSIMQNVNASDCDIILSGATCWYYTEAGMKPTVSNGSYSMLRGYIQTGNDCSLIAVHQHDMHPYTICICEETRGE